MKNARTKFVVALVLFIIGLIYGVLSIRYVTEHKAEADRVILGIVLLQMITIGTLISYLHDSDKSLEVQKRDQLFRFVSWLLILASILLTLLQMLLLLILNG